MADQSEPCRVWVCGGCRVWWVRCGWFARWVLCLRSPRVLVVCVLWNVFVDVCVCAVLLCRGVVWCDVVRRIVVCCVVSCCGVRRGVGRERDGASEDAARAVVVVGLRR